LPIVDSRWEVGTGTTNKGFLEMAGKNLESTMVEKWMEERVMEKIPGHLAIKRKFQVLLVP
jgi:hypothetical protein